MRIRYKPVFPAILLLVSLCAASLAQAAAPVPVDFRELVKATMPAVVNISTERTETVGPMANPFEMFRGIPDMERFFGPFEDFRQAPQTRKTNSLGSGVLISADGFIVTNNHVIEGADVITVNLSDKNGKNESYNAEVVGTDPETDLALLKIDAENVPFLTFGDSDALEVGEWVLAIGSPLGLDHTVTSGIISAKGRKILSGSYDDFLQTDASINRGNSGGPLINMEGKITGINTAIAQRAQGIGFAIPSNMAQRVINELRQHKKVSRGWLGVTIQNVDEATAKALHLREAKGALVNSALEGQPAARAGIRPGDVIIAVNDQEIADTEQLLRVVALLTPGSKAAVTLWRDGKPVKAELTVAERDLAGRGKEKSTGGKELVSVLGLKLRPISPDDIRRYNLSGNTGLLVTGVENDSLAAQAGIQPGDVILAANQQPMTSVEDLAKAISAAQKDHGVILLHVSRKGQAFFSAIDLRKK